MQTYLDMQTELLSRLMVAGSSTVFTTTRVQSLIKDAYLWAAGFYSWPQTERAQTTSTESGVYFYDYPPEFRTDSIIRIVIDDKIYKRKAFEDLLDYKSRNPTIDNRYIFADYGRQIFIFPTPTATGTDNFDVWGCVQPTQLSASGDKTIFSDSDDQGNEAIVKKAMGVGLDRINPSEALKQSEEAKQILGTIFNKILQRQQRDQRLDHPFFNVPDLFPTGHQQITGNFFNDSDLED